MQIAIIEGASVVRIGDYRELFPNTSFPPSGPSQDWMQENNCVGVTVFKTHDRRAEKLVPVSPYLEDGQAFTVVVEAKNQEELDADIASQWGQVRSQRNRLLSGCDWTQVADAPVNALQWAIYRQALRDVTLQSDPFNITWPVSPAEETTNV